MRKIILAFIALLCAVATVNADSLIESADSAYLAEDYQLALSRYQKVLNDEGASSDLYYNIGNTYYRLGQPGKAIINYERALKLDPTNSDASDNIKFVNSRIVDKTSDEGSIFTKIIDTTSSWLRPNAWAWLALVLFITVLVATALYIFSSSVVVRKASFFGGLLLLLFSGCAIALSVVGSNKARSDQYAVIITESTQLSTQPRLPRTRSEEAMLLHEGTKVEILDSLPSPTDSINPIWYDVRVNGEHRAWISATDVEKI